MKRICKHLITGIVLHQAIIPGITEVHKPDTYAWVSVGRVMATLGLSRNTAKRYLFAAVGQGLLQTKPGKNKRVGWLFRPSPLTDFARDYLLQVDATWYVMRSILIGKNRVNWSYFEQTVSRLEIPLDGDFSKASMLSQIPTLTTHGDLGIVYVDTGQGENPTGGTLPEMSV